MNEIDLRRASLGELLKHCRRGAGLTQEALAQRAGLSTRVISDLERNVHHAPRAATLQLLVEGLSLSDSERELFEAAASGDKRSPLATGSFEAGDLPPLIGRAEERALLEEHLDGEGPPLLMLAGEPGVGKSRLLREATSLASARGLYVLHGSASGLVHDGRADPVADALRQTIDRRSPVHLRGDLLGCAWLVRLLPELEPGPIQPLATSSVAEEHEAALVVRAVVRFLANVAGPAGALLLLDNMQHASAAALALLSRLVRSAGDVPLRVVATYRDDHQASRIELSTLLAGLAHEQLVRHVALRPLAAGDAAELLLACVKRRDGIATALVDRLVRETGGVPFYLIAWAHDLNIRRVESLDHHLPWPIRESIRSRIDSAPAAVRPVLEAIAVAGGRATYPALLAVAGPRDSDVLAALEFGTRARLIQEAGETHVFAYDVVRRAVELDLGQARRALLRRRLNAALPRATRDARKTRAAVGDPDATKVDAERAYHLAVLRRHRRSQGRTPPGGLGR